MGWGWLKPRVGAFALAAVGTGVLGWWSVRTGDLSLHDLGERVAELRSDWTKLRVSKLLTPEAPERRTEGNQVFFEYPREVSLGAPGTAEAEDRAVLEYSFDPELQESMERLFRQYRPDHGAFVAMDAETGRILALVGSTQDPDQREHVALRATFPSASIFKVVTAAAAIAERRFVSETPLTYNGRNHTLYRSQVLSHRADRWTRTLTLKHAFAKSVNTVFGRIGAFSVGHAAMRDYADRFGFNQRVPGDLQAQTGNAWIPEDAWGLAESSSGFTRENTMSPLQGALIAATIANDGQLMEPYAISSVYDAAGTPLYRAQVRAMGPRIDPRTASELRALMRETIRSGTSRGSFRRFFRGNLVELDVGGKTGSLTGMDPPGKYDWFIGFARSPEVPAGGGRALAEGSIPPRPRVVAVAALTVHRRQWRVKSSYLARRAFEILYPSHGQVARR